VVYVSNSHVFMIALECLHMLQRRANTLAARLLLYGNVIIVIASLNLAGEGGTMAKVAIIGDGWVGKAYQKMFPEALVYDEPIGALPLPANPSDAPSTDNQDRETLIRRSREYVNTCDMAIVCVPTNLQEDNSLDMSIVREVVAWLETPYILIKSALMPGTVDRLVQETGKKIAVSVELIGESNYFMPFWKFPHPTDPTYHQSLVVGGADDAATYCANVLWSRMSPDIDIHIVTAVEAEIAKLMENSYGAMKVTFANVMYDICQAMNANYIRVLEAFGSDGRVEKMHLRTMAGKRGWRSKCYDKDVPALGTLDKSGFIAKIVEANTEYHLPQNNLPGHV
jgi:UDPglucose 6-dehydrogenase